MYGFKKKTYVGRVVMARIAYIPIKISQCILRPEQRDGSVGPSSQLRHWTGKAMELLGGRY